MATATIQGLGEVQLARVEYTHPDVGREYNELLAMLTDIYARRPSVQQQQSGSFIDPRIEFSSADYDAIIDAITNLKNLAANGLQRNTVFGDPSSPIGTFYLTTRMASSLDLLIRSLEAAGIIVPPTLTTTQEKQNAVIRWIDLAGFGVTDILQSAASAGAISNRSLQSLIELEYVRVGNEVIFAGLNDLEEALRNTQSILETLNDLQEVRNLIGVIDVPTFEAFARATGFAGLFDLQTGGDDSFQDDKFVSQYKKAMSQYVKLVIPSVGFTHTFAGRIFGIRSRLIDHLEDLSRLNPGQGRSVQGTLAFNLDTLLKNFSAIFSTATPNTDINILASLIQDFILVNQGEETAEQFFGVVDGTTFVTRLSQATKSKNIALQTSINTAITSAQSLNDQQKQEVRRFLFVFEEFYKSASAVLTKISQLIEKFAQGISR